MSDTSLSFPIARRISRKRIFVKRVLQVVISYEVATYALAAVQALGLTLPAMVPDMGSTPSVTCEHRLQAVANRVAEFRIARPDSPLTYRESGILALVESLPKCPDGGRYEVVAPGTVVRTEQGTTFVASREQVVVRCVREDGRPLHSDMALAFSNIP